MIFVSLENQLYLFFKSNPFKVSFRKRIWRRMNSFSKIHRVEDPLSMIARAVYDHAKTSRRKVVNREIENCVIPVVYDPFAFSSFYSQISL